MSRVIAEFSGSSLQQLQESLRAALNADERESALAEDLNLNPARVQILRRFVAAGAGWAATEPHAYGTFWSAARFLDTGAPLTWAAELDWFCTEGVAKDLRARAVPSGVWAAALLKHGRIGPALKEVRELWNNSRG